MLLSILNIFYNIVNIANDYSTAIALWSNPGDIILTPFLGIGSEAYEALKMKRRAIGIELKESYFNQAVENCKSVEDEDAQFDMFSMGVERM